MKRKPRKPMTMSVSILIGLGSALIITLLLTATTAWLISAEKVGIEGENFAALLITTAAVIVGSSVAMSLEGRKGLQVGGITAGAYILILISCNALCFDGTYHGVWKSIISAAVGWIISLFSLRRGTGKGSTIKKRKAYR